MGLSFLWSNLMRGNFGRHGNNVAYEDWEAKYARLPCITNVTRTQGHGKTQRLFKTRISE